MRFLVAGLLASLIAWAGNSRLVTRGSPRVVVLLVPLWEEILKTGLAIGLGAPIFGTHTVFGVVEAVSDFYASPQGLSAGLAGLVGHMFFGYLTAATYLATDHLMWGLLGGMVAHIVWNLLVLKILDA